jgi:tryptophanyl-tRNA synthetase
LSKDTYAASVKRSAELEREIAERPSDFRILTGERPTGRLHIGHLFGSIQERVRLQQLGLETFIIIADYQVITDRDELGDVADSVYNIIIDNLAAGLDPKEAVFFTHSQVAALNQLLVPFLSLVTEAELHRNPTVKAELEASGRSLSGLLLTYPIHQAADILFCKGNVVPAGKDQLPHVEISRTLARRFNERFCGVNYGALEDGLPLNFKDAVFPEPEVLLSKNPHVPGLDGRKMSKSFGNAVMLGMTADETAAVVKKAPTDSTREVTYDPENRLGVSSLLTILALARGLETGGPGEQQLAEEINSDPKYGAGLLKQWTTDALNDYLAPHRARRAELAGDLGYIKQILKDGNAKANEIADATLDEVKQAMGTVY